MVSTGSGKRPALFPSETRDPFRRSPTVASSGSGGQGPSLRSGCREAGEVPLPGASFRLLPAREVVEPGVLADEPELHIARRAVAVLGQHDLGDAPLGFVFPVVVLGTMDEDDQVGVLFD